MVRTINVVYTTRKLSGSEARQLNMFSGMTTGGFNPMMLALANNEDMDMKDLMMIQMMQGNGGKPVDSNNITEWEDIEPIIVETKLEKK